MEMEANKLNQLIQFSLDLNAIIPTLSIRPRIRTPCRLGFPFHNLMANFVPVGDGAMNERAEGMNVRWLPALRK